MNHTKLQPKYKKVVAKNGGRKVGSKLKISSDRAVKNRTITQNQNIDQLNLKIDWYQPGFEETQGYQVGSGSLVNDVNDPN